ncbi:MAG: Rid family detoxifying hydrolase [Planctomycetota bacterium]
MKKNIKTDGAPAPVGAYNQAVVHDNTLYMSGQIALDPVTGELMTGDLETETRQVMENIKAILEAAGLTFDHVLKVSVFVSDMKQYDRINAVYSEYFDEAAAPARELIQVAALPKFVNVEISLVAASYSL